MNQQSLLEKNTSTASEKFCFGNTFWQHIALHTKFSILTILSFIVTGWVSHTFI